MNFYLFNYFWHSTILSIVINLCILSLFLEQQTWDAIILLIIILVDHLQSSTEHAPCDLTVTILLWYPQVNLQPKMLTEHKELHIVIELVAAGSRAKYLCLAQAKASKWCLMTYTNVCTIED